MSSTSNYFRLLFKSLAECFPNFTRRFEAIHNGHTDVHENDGVGVGARCVSLLYQIEGVQTIICPINNGRKSLNIQSLKYQEKADQIKWLIIHNQNTL